MPRLTPVLALALLVGCSAQSEAPPAFHAASKSGEAPTLAGRYSRIDAAPGELVTLTLRTPFTAGDPTRYSAWYRCPLDEPDCDGVESGLYDVVDAADGTTALTLRDDDGHLRETLGIVPAGADFHAIEVVSPAGPSAWLDRIEPVRSTELLDGRFALRGADPMVDVRFMAVDESGSGQFRRTLANPEGGRVQTGRFQFVYGAAAFFDALLFSTDELSPLGIYSVDGLTHGDDGVVDMLQLRGVRENSRHGEPFRIARVE